MARRAEPLLLMIAGSGRSGSTLLERLLAGSEGAVAVGELTEIWHRGLQEDERCGCGESFSACPFWRQVGELAFGGWQHVDPERMVALERRLGRFGLPLSPAAGISRSAAAALAEYGSALTAIYRAVGAVSGARVVVDASKWPRHLYVLRRLSLQLRVVHLIRDPRAVAYSWSRGGPRPHAAGGSADMQTYAPAGTALRWLAFNLLVDAAAWSGTPTQRLSYGRLIADPHAALSRIRAGLGLERLIGEPAIGPGAHSIVLSTSHGIAGNPMRFRHGAVELRHDQRWRHAMPRPQRLLVGAMCGPLALAYGAGERLSRARRSRPGAAPSAG